MMPAFLLIVPIVAALATLQSTPIPVAQQEVQQTPADRLDFTTEDVRMTVPVTIGPAGPYRFIVDTGAERTVIARELAATLGLAEGKGVRVTAMAGSASVGIFVIPDITIGAAGVGVQLSGTRIEAPALFRQNIGAAGLVGIDTLQGHAVTIDFASETMTVVPATRRTRREHFGPDDIVIRAKNLLGQLVVTDATYQGHKVRVVIDTGAVVSMGNLALQRLVETDTGPLRPVTLISVTGGVLEADLAEVGRIRVGQIGFAHLPVAFSDAAPFARLGLRDRPALFLGMDALRLFGRVRIDFANRELRLAQPARDKTVE